MQKVGHSEGAVLLMPVAVQADKISGFALMNRNRRAGSPAWYDFNNRVRMDICIGSKSCAWRTLLRKE